MFFFAWCQPIDKNLIKFYTKFVTMFCISETIFQARQLLNENERGTMNYYLTEYQKGHVAVDSLVLALSQLFNTQAKVSFLV